MAKQSELDAMDGPGVAAVTIKDVDDAFDILLGARSNRMKWGTKEKEAQAALIELFHKHNLKSYNFDDRVYQLKDIEKIVLAPKDDDDD